MRLKMYICTQNDTLQNFEVPCLYFWLDCQKWIAQDCGILQEVKDMLQTVSKYLLRQEVKLYLDSDVSWFHPALQYCLWRQHFKAFRNSHWKIQCSQWLDGAYAMKMIKLCAWGSCNTDSRCLERTGNGNYFILFSKPKQANLAFKRSTRVYMFVS